MGIYGNGSGFRLSEVAQEAKGTDKQNLFEITTKALLPIVLGILASAQGERSRFWGFLLLTVIAIGVSFYKPIISVIQGTFKRRSDVRFVRSQQRSFSQLVARFGEFVDPRSHHTFEDIVRREVCQNNSTRWEQLGIARGQIFSDIWTHLNKRQSSKTASVKEFSDSLDEFLSLVNNYTRYCLDPVFESLPNEIRNELRPHSRAELEAFREQFITFRNKLDDFAREVSQSLPRLRSGGYYIARPKPLFQAESPRSS